MTEAIISQATTWSTAALEQLRAVGLAVRRESALLCAGLVVFLVVAPIMERASGFGLEPGDLGILALLTGLVYPLVVWKGESGFGESQLWTLPFDHTAHARLKVGAGWVWLMGVVVFGVIVISLAVLAAGGTLGREQTRLVATDLAGAREGLSQAITAVQWRTPAWHWVLPFVSATGAYLAASVLMVGTRRPLHWAVGLWAVFIALAILGEDGRGWAVSEWVVDALANTVDRFATGGTDEVLPAVLLESGRRSNVWIRLPTFGHWAVTAVVSFSVVLGAFWMASARHREG